MQCYLCNISNEPDSHKNLSHFVEDTTLMDQAANREQSTLVKTRRTLLPYHHSVLLINILNKQKLLGRRLVTYAALIPKTKLRYKTKHNILLVNSATQNCYQICWWCFLGKYLWNKWYPNHTTWISIFNKLFQINSDPFYNQHPEFITKISGIITNP